MKLQLILISIFLTWVTYDSNLFRRRTDSYAVTSIELSEEDLQKKKQRQRVRLDVIPKRYRGAKKPVRHRVNHFSPKSRDVRSSNQKKIRRRFNNA